MGGRVMVVPIPPRLGLSSGNNSQESAREYP
jgi:hypothetical protein